MKVLIDINRYMHDFAAAMWVCGSILMWLLLQERRRGPALPDVAGVLAGITRKLRFVTIPSLFLSLATGGLRAATFVRYENPGEVTAATVMALVVKHVVFAGLVAWGLWVHRRSAVAGQPPPLGL